MSKAAHAESVFHAISPARRGRCIRHDIRTVAGLVAALGGEDAVAYELDVIPQTVGDWVISGNIPTGWHLRLFAWVCVINKTISPSVFGFRDRNKAGLALSDMMMAARRAAEGGHDHV